MMKIKVKEKQKKYTPFTKGKYDVSPGLFLLTLNFKSGDPENFAFQIDEKIYKYLENKKECRADDMQKYYQRFNENEATVKTVNRFIIKHLTESYPDFFQLTLKNNENKLSCILTGEDILYTDDFQLISGSKYITFYDALSSQVPEDVVICQLDDKTDWLSTIHLCSPSYWSAAEKIGMDFNDVHIPVPGMEKLRQNARPILEAVIRKGPFYRFIWEINTDTVLNHATREKQSLNPNYWQEKKFDPEKPELYVRVERQVIIGFPENNAFLFTIRTFHTDIKEFSSEELALLKQSLLSMLPESVEYKRLKDNLDRIVQWLDQLLCER